MHRSPRIRDVVSGLAATIALIGIVVGVPAALVKFVGWPLPTVPPSVEAVVAALRYGQIAPDTLFKTIAVVVWCAWLLASCSIAIEAVAVARGTVAATLPAAGGLQRLASRLVATVMLLSSLTTRAAAAAPDALRPADVAPLASTTITAPDLGVPALAADPNAQPQAATVATWEVQRRDSLWTIAERTLGDGQRWRQIRDLNVNRRQPDGAHLRADDTLIQPGWVLELPADAAGGERPDQVRVERGDDLWSLAEVHLGDGDRWRQIYDHNVQRAQPDGQRLTDPDLIRPGWVLQMPEPTTAEAGGSRPAAARASHGRPGHTSDRRQPASDEEPLAPTASQPSATSRSPVARPPAADEPAAAPVAQMPVTPSTLAPAAGGTGVPDPGRVTSLTSSTTSGPRAGVPALHEPGSPTTHRLAVPAAALLAGGLVAALAQRRRRWLRVRDAGTALVDSDPEAAELERWLRAMADHDVNRRTGQILRVLTEHFGLHDVHPAVAAMQLGEQVRLLLATADDTPPPGVTAEDDGMTWRLDPRLEMMAPPPDQPPFLPALVCCGQLPQGDLLLLNLLHSGTISVDGTPPQVADAITSWAAELATADAARGIEIVVVGRHHHLIEQFPRITIAADTTAVIDRVQRVAGASGSTPSALPEATAGIVILCAQPLDPATHDQFAQLGTDPRVAVVLTGSASARQRLELRGGQVTWWPSGTELTTPEWLDPDDWDRFGDLLRHPARQQTSELVAAPLIAPLSRAALGGVVLSGVDDEPAQHMVRVLGPVQVGHASPPTPAARDLLAYLALQRDGAAAGRLTAHVWPGRQDGDEQLRAAMQAARGVLGAAALLEETDDGRYRLAGEVGCDLEQFRLLISGLDHVPAAEQAGRMRRALELVRGEPFAAGCHWAHAEGLATATAALISDIAHRLALLLVTFGDLDRADWAVDQGLLANPACELLYRDRMRVADARGDVAAVHALMKELRAERDGWLTAETEQLYERLTRSPRLQAGWLQQPADLDADAS